MGLANSSVTNEHDYVVEKLSYTFVEVVVVGATAIHD
jgi:hypothetical protein